MPPKKTTMWMTDWKGAGAGSRCRREEEEVPRKIPRERASWRELSTAVARTSHGRCCPAPEGKPGRRPHPAGKRRTPHQTSNNRSLRLAAANGGPCFVHPPGKFSTKPLSCICNFFEKSHQGDIAVPWRASARGGGCYITKYGCITAR